MNCRHCRHSLQHVLIDLGCAPPSNAFLTQKALLAPEITYPLKLYVCENCWLVQTEDHAGAEQLFDDSYPYFSSTSQSWLKHAANYTRDITKRLELGSESLVVEIACNDGYLLRNFVAASIPCLGVEPTACTARVAEKLGIPVIETFFGRKTAHQLVMEGKLADLICGNNVYAHVPDINDFTDGIALILKRGGTVNLEFPHLMHLISQCQFDTIYHEHYSYLSLTTVSRIFDNAGLRIFDVEELPTHGGSLRIYGCHHNDPRENMPAVAEMLDRENRFGLCNLETYQSFQFRAEHIKNEFLSFLLQQKRSGLSVAAYGAAAKGNTLLNFAGVKSDLIAFVCDGAPSKQGKFLPGSRIPVLPPDELANRKPDRVIILPWNIADEIVAEQQASLAPQACFVVAMPILNVMT